jgi:peptidoglycan/LPS O-acetylase OafA/YrhL
VTEKSQIDGLQVMRGLAAFLVVFHHAGMAVASYHSSHSALNTFGSLLDFGASGVDIFFVLSGFIITYTLRPETGPSAAARFALRRLERVAPLYWVWTTVLLGLALAGLVLKGMALSPAYVAGSYGFIPVAKPAEPASFHPILDQGWSLSYEMYFYLVCALGILLRARHALFTGLAIFAIFILAQFPGTPVALRVVAGSPLVFEFLAGVVIATVVPRGRPKTGAVLIAAGLFLLATSVAFPHPEEYRVLVWGVPAALLIAGAAMSSWSAKGVLGKAGVYCGEASYSVYLTHAFGTLALGTALKHGKLQGVPADACILAATIGIFVACAMAYRFTERPLQSALRGLSKNPTSIRQAVVAAQTPGV